MVVVEVGLRLVLDSSDSSLSWVDRRVRSAVERALLALEPLAVAYLQVVR